MIGLRQFPTMANSMQRSISILTLGWRTTSSIRGASVCEQMCVRRRISHVIPPCCHLLPPQGLLWRMMLINLVEITSSILAVPSIARMTSSPSPLSPLFHRRWKQSRREKSLKLERSSFRRRERFHLSYCSFSASHNHIYMHNHEPRGGGGGGFALAEKFPH